MGNNSSKYDRRSSYANKSLKKIQAELTSFTVSYDKISSADYAGISKPFDFFIRTHRIFKIANRGKNR